MARVPVSLATKAKAYAQQRRLTMSDLLRAGLAAIVTENEISTTNTTNAENILEVKIARQIAKTAEILVSFPLNVPSSMILGKLCPRRHEYEETGMTLLTLKKRRCLQCENERKREQRHRKRARETKLPWKRKKA